MLLRYLNPTVTVRASMDGSIKPPTFMPSRDAVETLGVSQSSLRRWDKAGKIPTIRTPGGQRLYDITTFERVQSGESEAERERLRAEHRDSSGKRICIAYARVSGVKQKEDLRRQEESLSAAYPGFQVLSDIGSGLNFKRKNFQRVVRSIMQGKVECLVVAHKDRLCRFAFELLQFICRENSTRLVVHTAHHDGSPESELMEDLMAVVHVFSSRLYGKRRSLKRKRISGSCDERDQEEAGHSPDPHHDTDGDDA